MLTIKRNGDENFQEYMIRLFENKDTYELTCTQIAELLNFESGDSKSESYYRKFYNGFKQGQEYERSKAIAKDYDATVLDELDAKREEIKRERLKLQATKLDVTRNLRQDSRFELFYENVKEAIVSLEPPKFTGDINVPVNKTSWLVSLADIHYGARYKSINNKYSRQEVVRRFDFLLSWLKDFVEREDIDTLKIVNVSDTVQGLLRLSDLQLNEIPVVDAVVEISRIIAQFLNQLSSVCSIEYYHVTSANHSQTRPLGSKASELAHEDVERIIVSYISDLLVQNERVKVISDTEHDYVTFKIFDFEVIAFHGHQVKCVPDLLKNVSNLYRKFYDYAILGHSHSAKEIISSEGRYNNSEILVVPSFCGSDPYSDSLMVGSKPACKAYEFDEIQGRISSKMIILN